MALRKKQHSFKCEVCSQEKFVKKSYEGRFCSKRCTSIAQSKGLVASHINGRSGYRTDIENSPYFKSSFEADYYRYHIFIGGEIPMYEHKTFSLILDEKQKCYTPDFWFKSSNEHVELKGVKFDETNDFSKLLNSNHNVRERLITEGTNVKVIYMSDFYNELRSNGLYFLIPNLENRNYEKTRHLIVKHDQN